MIGIDVGGANLKFFDAVSRVAKQTNFPLWKHPERLGDQLNADLQFFANVDEVVVTITGELADCFTDRADGIARIVDQTMDAATRLGIASVRFYGTDGVFHDSVSAVAQADTVAAANWHALASAVARTICRDGLLIDIGSTTTDIIRLRDGVVATDAMTDHQRLIDGSLVYVGCRRTPVCSLVESLTIDSVNVPVMKESFATIDDACLILHHASEDATDCETADGRPRTIPCARRRLAKMIGLDDHEVTDEDARRLGEQIITAAQRRIAALIENAWQTCLHGADAPPTLVLSGHGHSLVMPVLPAGADRVIDLRDQIGVDASRCAPCWAICQLATAMVIDPQ